MKKLKKLAIYIATNASIMVLAYFAVIKGVEGAANLLYFVIGCMFVLALLSSIPEVQRKTAEAMTEPLISTIPSPLNLAVDFSFAAFLVWYGWWWAGIGMLVSGLLWASALTNLRRLSQENILNKLSS